MSRASPRFKRVSPPLPAVGTSNGVVLYRILGQLEGQMTLTTFYYSAAVPLPTPAQLATLLTNISTALFGAYKGAICVDWSCTSEQLTVVHRNDVAGKISTANAGAVGVRTSPHLPTEVAVVLLRQSAVKGQHGRGRLSLPAVSAGDVTASKIAVASEITALNLLASQMLLTVSDGTNTWTPCITQRATTPPRLVVGFSALTAVTPNVLLGTVRRRKIGRGK